MKRLAARRAFVTGASGFLGANLVRRLIESGAEVHALHRPSSDLWRLQDVRTRITLHRADIRSPDELRKVLRLVAPEFIFHLAARGVSRSDSDRRELFEANVVGTANLLEASNALDYERFIHVGASSEYGSNALPMSESDCLEPVTAYGASKAAATLLCRQFARSEGRRLVILRPFSVYGPWEPATRLIPTAILAALHGRDMALTVPGIRRDLVFVDDVMDACLAAAERGAAPGEIVNVGSGREWSNEEVVAAVEALCGRKVRARPGEYPLRASDAPHWVAGIQKAERVLGWKPTHSLDQGLEKTIAWWSRVGSTVGVA